MKIKRIPKKGLPTTAVGHYVLFAYSERKLTNAQTVVLHRTQSRMIVTGFTHYARIPAYFSP